MTGESQSGSAQIDEFPESIVINCIPVGDNKEVMITQIIDTSLPENEDDELEESVPSSVYGKKLAKEKQPDMLAAETQHIGKSNMGLPPIIIDKHEAVERQWGRAALYHKPQHLAPKRG